MLSLCPILLVWQGGPVSLLPMLQKSLLTRILAALGNLGKQGLGQIQDKKSFLNACRLEVFLRSSLQILRSTEPNAVHQSLD